MTNIRILTVIVFLINIDCLLQAQSQQGAIDQFIRKYQEALNSGKGYNAIQSEFFNGLNISIENDINSKVPSSSEGANKIDISKYVQFFKTYRCQVYFTDIKIEGEKKYSSDNKVYLVSYNRTLNCKDFNGDKRRYSTIEYANGKYLISGVAFSRTSKNLSVKWINPSIPEITPLPPVIVDGNKPPVRLPPAPPKVNFRSYYKEYMEQKSKVEQLGIIRDTLNNRLTRKTKEFEAEKAKNEDLTIDITLLRKNFDALVLENGELRKRIKFLEDKWIQDSIENAETKRKAELALDEAWGEYKKLSIMEGKITQQSTVKAKNDFREKEKDVVALVWDAVSQYKKYMDCEQNLEYIKFLNENRLGVINNFNPDKQLAQNLATQDQLIALNKAFSNYDCRQSADNIVKNIGEYINKVEVGPSEITSEFEKAIKEYDKRNYSLALDIFSKYQNKIINQAKSLDIQYRYGTILLWNLGNIENTKGLASGKTRKDIEIRKSRGSSLLNEVFTNAPTGSDLKKKAGLALAKYY